MVSRMSEWRTYINDKRLFFSNKVAKCVNTTKVEKEFCLMLREFVEGYQAFITKDSSIGEALADVAISLIGLVEIVEIDLQIEIEQKVMVNEQRHYLVIDGVLTSIDEPER